MLCERYHSSLSPFSTLMNYPLCPLIVVCRKLSIICASAVFKVRNTLSFKLGRQSCSPHLVSAFHLKALLCLGSNDNSPEEENIADVYSEENGKFTLCLAVLHQQPKNTLHAERFRRLKALSLGLESFHLQLISIPKHFPHQMKVALSGTPATPPTKLPRKYTTPRTTQ